MPYQITVPTRIAEARLMAIAKMRYMAHLITALVPVPVDGLGTCAVDSHLRMYYDLRWCEAQKLEEVAGVVLHEALHPFLRHDKRCRAILGDAPSEADLLLWNIAADVPINDMLLESGMAIPKGGCTSESLELPKNLLAEEYFELLKKTMKVQHIKLRIGGSGADGQPRPWEMGRPGPDDVAHGISDSDLQDIGREVASAIEKHMRAYGKGSMPAGLARLAKDILHPKRDVVSLLMAECRYAVAHIPGFGSQTWTRPKRRTWTDAPILPSPIKPIPRVLAIIDTSGSMADSDLNLALGCVAQVIRRLPDPSGVEVWTGDMRLETCQRITKPEQVKLVGGGGTDMGALIVHAASQRPIPNAILICTDGWTGWPANPVTPTVVAAITQARNGRYGPPPWIRTVYLHEEGE